MDSFDIAVIGSGAAGLSFTYVAARLGRRVALIERARMGGDCLNAGCVPSKALLAAAHAAQAAQRAHRLGVRTGEPVIEWDAVRRHVHGAIARIAPMDSQERYEALGATVLRGHARFAGPRELDIDGRRIVAKRIVIAAGSRPAAPPIPGLDTVDYLTNETVFGLERKPERLLILGGGPIGLEMAQAHAGLGCRVTLVTAGRIAAKDDEQLAGLLRAELEQDGVEIIEQAEVAKVEAGPALLLRDGRRVAGSHLLVAAGRVPSLDGLGLDAAGVRTTRRGIATDAGLRSVSARHVYAAGDIADPEGIGPRMFTHVGSYHAGILARRILFRLPAKLDYAALPRVTYTDPELAQVGLMQAEAESREGGVRALCWSLDENDRAIAESRTVGLTKLVVSKSGRLLGAGILAPHAGEMIGAWTLALGRKLPLSALANMIVPYPTLAEAGKRAAGSAFADRLFSPKTRLLTKALGWLP